MDRHEFIRQLKSQASEQASRLHDMPESELPVNRLPAYGIDALSDADLLALLLGASRAALGKAYALLNRFGSLGELRRLGSVDAIQQTPGIGKVEATRIVVALRCGVRLAREKVQDQRVDSPEIVYELLGPQLAHEIKEHLVVLLLSTRYRLIHQETVSVGSLNESVAHPREILRPAIEHGAYAIILAHNHPSGDPAPSRADRDMTRRLFEAAGHMQIELADHVIIGRPQDGAETYFSFKEMGLL